MTTRYHQLWLLSWAVALATLSSCRSTPHQDARENPADSISIADPSIGSDRWLNFSAGVRGIFEDSKGNLWISSPEGTYRYNPSAHDSADGGLTYFTEDLTGIAPGRIQEDSEGRIWIQNANGIFSYDGTRFTPITDRNYDARLQWEKASGDLWFGLDGREPSEEEGQYGVYRYHDGEFTFLAFPEAPSGERHHFFPLTAGAMHGMNGMLWFGTFEAAFGFNGESFDIVGRKRMGRADDPRDIGIRGYHLDAKGNLWMADNGVGVYVYNGDSVVHFTAIHSLRDEDTDGNSLQRAFSIAEDNDGNFWFGTAYSGVWRYEPSETDPIGKGTFTNYADDQGCTCEIIWTIYKTRSGELLFACDKPGGVYRFNGKSFERVF